MAAPLFTDQFTGTSGAPDSLLWDSFASPGCTCVLSSNTLNMTMDGTSGDYAAAETKRYDIGPDVDLYVDFVAPNPIAGAIRQSVYWRCGPTSDPTSGTHYVDSYAMLVRQDAGTYFIDAYKGGVNTNLVSGASFAISAGDTVHIRILHVGTSLRIKLWKNTAVEPTTWQQTFNTSLWPTTPGKVTLETYNGTAVAGSGAFDALKVRTVGPTQTATDSCYYRAG